MRQKINRQHPKPASFWSMFIRPQATLDALQQHPRWFYPTLTAALLSAAVNYYAIQSIGFARLIAAVSKNQGYLDLEATIENALAHKSQILAVQAATAFLSPFVMALAIATVLWLLLTLLGHDIPWKKHLAIAAHANMLATVIQEIMIALTVFLIPDPGGFDLGNPLATNIAFFIKPQSPALLRLFHSLDLLTFLNMALLILGLTRLCPKLSLRSAIMLVAIPWMAGIGGLVLVPSLLA